jgi:hypothetical protein
MSFKSSCPKGCLIFQGLRGTSQLEDKLEVKFKQLIQATEDYLLNWMCSGLLCPGDQPHVSICPTICSDHRRKKPIGSGAIGGEKNSMCLNRGQPRKAVQVMEAQEQPRQLQWVRIGRLSGSLLRRRIAIEFKAGDISPRIGHTLALGQLYVEDQELWWSPFDA